MNRRVGWHQLPFGLRERIEESVGSFEAEEHISHGHNCLVGMVLTTTFGQYFLKGVSTDKASALRTQHNEYVISPYITWVSPQLIFHVQSHGWDVLGFEYLEGYRAADLSPGSADLPKIAATLRVLARVPVPEGVEVKRIEQRWRKYAGSNADLLAGKSLCHTDLHRHNILIGPTARLVDWAWPTAGKPWIDAGCVALQLIEAGHEPKEAEAWCDQFPAFSEAKEEAVNTLVSGVAGLWADISTADPQPWKVSVAMAAQEWAKYRGL